MDNLKAQRAELKQKLDTLNDEGRFDAAKRRAAARIEEQIDELDAQLGRNRAPVWLDDGHLGCGGRDIKPAAGPEYRNLFPRHETNTGGFDSFGDFLIQMRSGRMSSALEARAMSGSVPADGAFAVPEIWAAWLLDESLRNEVVRPLCRSYAMTSDTLNIPAWSTTDLSAGGVGGAIAYFINESTSITESTPKLRQVSLHANKLAIFLKASLEVSEDAIGFGNEIARAMSMTMAHYIDKSLIRGSGAGEPRGLINAPCAIEVSADSGQIANTITFSNLAGMYSRMWPAAQRRAVWICHPDTLPELLQVTIEAGTAGQWIPLMNESSGQFTIFGRPVHFSSHCSTLGDSGDVIFFDPESYAVGLVGGGMRFDFSDHAFFQSAERGYRGLIRFDGAPLLASPITPAQGTTTVSPVVLLETR